MVLSPLQVLLIKDLVQKNSFKIRKWMEVDITSNMKFLKLYSRGREAKNWGNIGTSRYVRSQSTVKISLTPDHTVGVHNTLAMWLLPPIYPMHTTYPSQ